MILNKVYNSLFSFDNKGNIINELVKSYKINKNKLEIKINLKKNYFFSNGKNLNSQDVIESIKLYLNRKSKYPYRSNLNFIKSIRPVNKYEFVINLKYKFAPWKNYLTFKILNYEEIQKLNPNEYKTHLFLGTGNYRFYKVKPPSKIILLKNEYSKEKNNFEKLVFKVILDTKTNPLKLINKEIDIAEILVEDVKPFEKNKKIRILKFNKFGYYFIVFNLKRNIDYKIRKLFYNTLYNTKFLKKFLNNRGKIVKSPILLLNNSKRIKHIKEKPEKLNSRIRLTILTNSESRIRRNFILFLTKEMKKHNIYLKPLFFEYHKFIKSLKSKNFDIALSGFLLDIDYDISDIVHSKSPFNYSNFSNTEFDELLESGNRELDEVKRKNIYIKIHNKWLKELPIIPLFSLYYYVGINKKITPNNFYKIVGSITDPLYNINLWNLINY